MKIIKKIVVLQVLIAVQMCFFDRSHAQNTENLRAKIIARDGRNLEFEFRSSRAQAYKSVVTERTSDLSMSWDAYTSTSLGSFGISRHVIEVPEDAPETFFKFKLNTHLLRTPESRFDEIDGFDYVPKYAHIGEEGLRIAFIDEGEGIPIILLHGVDSWSYVWRNYIGPLTESGLRVIAIDMPGYGRSDKPASLTSHTKESHHFWLNELLIKHLDIENAVVVASTIMTDTAARLLVDSGERFIGFVALSPSFHDGSDEGLNSNFRQTFELVKSSIGLPIGDFVAFNSSRELTPEEHHAFSAPFNTTAHKEASLSVSGSLEPTSEDHPSAENQKMYWNSFKESEIPILVLSSDHAVQSSWIERYKNIPGASGQPHHHFPAETANIEHDFQEEVLGKILEFMDQFRLE